MMRKPASRLEQSDRERATGLEEMLTIVEHDQRAARREMPRQSLGDRPPGFLGNGQGGRHRVRQAIRIRERCEVDEPDPSVSIPGSKRSARRRARRVFPEPPTPVSVSSRAARWKRRQSSTAPSRPTKLVAGRGSGYGAAPASPPELDEMPDVIDSGV